jgi:ferredoxin-NADP reductase
MILTLDAKASRGDNVWTFRLVPAQPISWIAGQFIKIGLPHSAPDAAGTSRQFTIAAAPYEQAISITTRITGTTFKQALAALSIGQPVNLLDTPAGDFIWREAATPHIFVAQGIGITPFYAIIKDRRHQDLPLQAHLMYASRPGSEILYKSELEAWASADPTLHVTFQTHPVTPDTLAEKFPDLAKRFVYVSGPKPLIALCMPPYNLPPSRLKQDNFPGYAAGDY